MEGENDKSSIHAVERWKKKMFTHVAHNSGIGWSAIFLENHDQSRCLNKFLERENISFYSASALASIYFFLYGTPFIYQGQEIGMIIPFMLLRKFSGGYHAKTLFRCMIISCLLLFLCMEITIHISYSWNILMFAGIAGSSLIIQSPIDSENKRLEEVQKRQYRKIVCGFVMFFLALIFILWKLNAQKYAVSIAVGIWLSAGLQIPCLIK